MYLKQAKYLTQILNQEGAGFADEVREIMEIIEKSEREVKELIKNKNRDFPKDDTEEYNPKAPLVNGNVYSVGKVVKVMPPVDVQHKGPNNDEEAEAKSSKIKNRRKTVAFNFVEETKN